MRTTPCDDEERSRVLQRTNMLDDGLLAASLHTRHIKADEEVEGHKHRDIK